MWTVANIELKKAPDIFEEYALPDLGKELKTN
jgi:hypothetical protein